jgi:hypothetical protein
MLAFVFIGSACGVRRRWANSAGPMILRPSGEFIAIDPLDYIKKIYDTYKYTYTLILLAHRNKYIDIFNLTYKIIIEE